MLEAVMLMSSWARRQGTLGWGRGLAVLLALSAVAACDGVFVGPQPPEKRVGAAVAFDDAWLLLVTTTAGLGNPLPDLAVLRTTDFASFERVATLLDFGPATAHPLADALVLIGSYQGFDGDGAPFESTGVAVSADGRTFSRVEDPPPTIFGDAIVKDGILFAAGASTAPSTWISTSTDGRSWTQTEIPETATADLHVASDDTSVWLFGEGPTVSRTTDGADVTTDDLGLTAVSWLAFDGTRMIGEGVVVTDLGDDSEVETFALTHDPATDTFTKEARADAEFIDVTRVDGHLYGHAADGLYRGDGVDWTRVITADTGLGRVTGANGTVVVTGDDVRVSTDDGETFTVVPRDTIVQALED